MKARLRIRRMMPLDGWTGGPTTLIDYTVSTAFQIVDYRLQVLRQQPWVLEVNRKKGDSNIQIIVRVAHLPAEYKGDQSHEAFCARLLTLLRGW